PPGGPTFPTPSGCSGQPGPGRVRTAGTRQANRVDGAQASHGAEPGSQAAVAFRSLRWACLRSERRGSTPRANRGRFRKMGRKHLLGKDLLRMGGSRMAPHPTPPAAGNLDGVSEKPTPRPITFTRSLRRQTEVALDVAPAGVDVVGGIPR